MKSKIIKRIAGFGAIGIAGVFGVGILLNTVLSVKAEETLFGIENLIQEVQSREEPFRILELVPDEGAAEIGYYVPGYEPVLSAREAGSGEWRNWQENLGNYKTRQERREYMTKLKEDLQEFYALRGFEGEVPVKYQGYAESDEPAEGYTELALAEEVKKGYFVPYSGEAESYDVDFYYAGNYTDAEFTGELSMQYYYVKDAQVLNRALIEDLDDNAVIYTFNAQTTAEHFEREGTWGELKDEIEDSVSSGNGTVSGSDTELYYMVELERWQQGETPAYVALYGVGFCTQTDDGTFGFIETEDGFEYNFGSETVYYKGGFVNNEWLHTKVLNMETASTERFPVEVITLTPAELNELEKLPEFDMLYLNSGMQAFTDSETLLPYSGSENDLDDGTRLALFSDVIAEAKPCIVDAAILYTTNGNGAIEVDTTIMDTAVFRLAAMFLQTSPTTYYTDIVLAQAQEPAVVDLLEGIVTDTDKNFVVEQTYSYYAPETLVGPDFDMDDIYQNGVPVKEEVAEGFQAVIDEIKSENLNREADSSGEYAPLSMDISQASVVRHIMNYSNRRQIEVKENIRVLEIQPVKSAEDSYDLTEEEVKSWAPGVKTVQIDRMTTAEFIGKIEDINEIYDMVYIGTDRDYLNTKAACVSYLPEATSFLNGTFENGLNNWKPNGSDNASITTTRSYVYAGSRALRLKSGTATQIFKVEPGYKYRLTAYGKVSGSDRRGTVGIDLMTSSSNISGGAGEVEFTSTTYEKKSFTFTAGENITYLQVYIWSKSDSLYVDNITVEKLIPQESDLPGSTVFNDSSMDGLIYFHTGDLRYTSMELAGQLDTEYVQGKRENNVYYYNPMRYSGNDITDEKRKALISFLDASYPIIISDEVFESAATIYHDADWKGCSVKLNAGRYTEEQLNELGVAGEDMSSLKVSDGYQVTLYHDDNYNGTSKTFTADASLGGTEWNDKVRSIVIEAVEGQEALRTRKVDADRVDDCSYMYDFINGAMGKPNFYTRGEMGPDSNMFQFYLNRPKVSLTGVVANDTSSSEVINIYPQPNAKYMLEYKFTIQNEGAASAETKYACELYIDINADGKYSGSEALADITVTQNGKQVNATELYAGREYVLRRYVPDGYKGVLPWKIQVSQVNNKNIHNGVTGYTKMMGMPSEELKILQICRDQVSEVPWFGGEDEVLFNLKERIADPTDIYHILIYGGTYDGVRYEGISKDFTINVDFMKISQFEKAYAEAEAAGGNLMDEYNMLILGFSDAYGNISGSATEGPISGIINFIESGKSVLFAHDTVSYFNYEKMRVNDRGRSVAREGATSHSNPTNNTKLTNQYHNSYNLTQNIRGLVGMDRYGVTTISGLRQGIERTSGDSFWSKLTESGKEIAYIPKSGKSKATGLTQGYTYSIINAKDIKNEGVHESFTADETGTTAFTNTYLNLDYGTVYYRDDSMDDGEIPDGYNCEVTNLWVTKVNSGQITDYPYKLSDEFQVSNTHAQYYQLDFTADDDLDEQSDLVVWYCLGHRTNSKGKEQETIYSMSPNDVSNNYYIYNKGNITYTGVGHAGNKTTVDEAKLFINTMIASYNAGIKDPVISILNDATSDAQEISAFYSYYDESNNIAFDSSETTDSGSADKQKLYFSVTDTNFVKGTRDIAIRCYYESQSQNAQEIVYDGKVVKVEGLPVTVYEASTNKAIGSMDDLDSGVVYYILFDQSVMGNYDSRFSIYFEAQSTITTKGAINNSEYKVQTGKSYSRFDYTRTQLFDLE